MVEMTAHIWACTGGQGAYAVIRLRNSYFWYFINLRMSAEPHMSGSAHQRCWCCL